MFTISLHLFYYVLNFVKKIITGKNASSRRDSRFCHYVVAKSSSFEAECKLVDEQISFNPPVYIQRYLTATDLIKNHVSHSSKPLKVVDFGCAEVSYFEYLKRIEGLTKVLCIDIDEELLQRYHTRAKPLPYNHLMPGKIPFSVDILAGSIAVCDPCLLETDIFVSIELIEHLYPHELNAVPWTVFGYIQPKIAIFTTPNVEFNVMFKGLKGFRHDDHKFEWTRREFHDWGENIILRYPNYEVYFSGIGPGPSGTEHLGCVSQMAVFIRKGSKKKDESTQSEVSSYKLIKSYDFPFEIDTRSDTEKIRDEVRHHRIKFAYMEPYVSQDVIKIELFKFMPYVKEWCDSIEKLKDVLESYGTTIEKNENEDPCVVGISDEFIESEEEFDFENENDQSRWGTYEAVEEEGVSLGWDCTEIPQESWDSWGYADHLLTSETIATRENWDDWGDEDPLPNSKSIVQDDHPLACKFDADVISKQDLPSCEINCQIPNKENEIESQSRSNERSSLIKEGSNTRRTSGKKNHDRKFKRKPRNPLIRLIDARVNEEVVKSIEAVKSITDKSRENVQPVSPKIADGAQQVENLGEEGVWIISDELKLSKPHKRNYKKYKTSKNNNKGWKEKKSSKGLRGNQKSATSVHNNSTLSKNKDLRSNEGNPKNSVEATNDGNLKLYHSQVDCDSSKDKHGAYSTAVVSNAIGENFLNSTRVSHRLSNSESGLGSLESLEAQDNCKKFVSVPPPSNNVESVKKDGEAISCSSQSRSSSSLVPHAAENSSSDSTLQPQRVNNRSPKLNSRRKPRKKKHLVVASDTSNSCKNLNKASETVSHNYLNNFNEASESGTNTSRNEIYRSQPLSVMNKLEASSLSNQAEQSTKFKRPKYLPKKHNQNHVSPNVEVKNPKNPFMNSILKFDED